MAAERSWVNAMRAETLAKLYLTRHEGLDVIPIAQYSRSPGYDILVRLHEEGKAEGPQFAVEVKGIRGKTTARSKSPRVQINPDAIKSIDLPVVLFVFDVDEETGFYLWLNEPVVTADDKAVLRTNRDWPVSPNARQSIPVQWANLQPLDDPAVKGILRRVVDWYRARNCSTSSTDGQDGNTGNEETGK